MITSTLLMSKTLAAAIYDDSQETLQLDFRDGSRYIYSRVHSNLFHAMLAATSKGRFFNQYIRRVLPYSKAAPET
jgi:hypothetical protein